MSKRPAKSETLTIRLDPKTRFMLEFVARLRGQTITTVVERAISDAANRATIEVQEVDYSRDGVQTTELSWRDFWSVNDGERALKIARQPDLHPTYDEEKRLAFCRTHWPFFFTGGRDDAGMKTGYLEVLWPRIDEFVAMFDSTKSENYFAAGNAMLAALRKANVAAPDWPPKAGNRSSRDLDEEIPF